ncbi:protein kinase family protein [Melia azedarach]|uniref:Protein kinase family protein n=1 Tax=Melia azedarach TaxID=155640 RepID=A0ACC1Y4U9_MELAZ|nr:protein kinase family protein [Melia azedarach]
MEIKIFEHFVLAFLGIISLIILEVNAQSQSGFISIDCGISGISGYTDKKTGINYTSDANYVDSGINSKISPEFNSEFLEQQFLNLRSFPEGKRNCYAIKPPRGNTKFLIRARFMYGNYDGLGKPPNFDLLLEADIWDSVELEDESTIVTKEIIHIPQKNPIYVCLVNTGSGTPFISALELRPVKNSTYPTQSGSLLLFQRWDIGSTSNQTIRYPDDVFDRIWSPDGHSFSYKWVPISTTSKVVSITDLFQPPSSVMQTAVVPVNGSSFLQLSWVPSDPKFQYYAYLFFAEIDNEQGNNLAREMTIIINGIKWYGPFPALYLTTNTIYSTSPMSAEKIEFSINATRNSTLPPLLNALEIFRVKEILQLLTNQQDADAIMNIKSNFNDYDPPRITALNLSSSGIAGEIAPYISSLTAINILDLSNNSLTGPVPEFLSQLPFLTELNLKGNKLRGTIPAGLIEKQRNGLLSLSAEGNPDLCPEASCSGGTHEKNIGKNKGSFELKNQRFSYSDVVRITNNFEMVLGRGGFGTVYHGYLDDIQVAVKMLSPSSVQGYKQFQAEVELLMRVHHKNLTTLVGYCDEGTNMGLIYEFMAKGNLQEHLTGDEADILSWEGRLRIGTEAAQGLEYLHNGCKPPIVHRDVKSTNILLNEKFQAKLADFGLSRIFPVEGGTHVSTTIVGTPGYLDPEYFISNRLTEKSDVYSFGVVLLEIITSKPVIDRTHTERTHISEWVSFRLANWGYQKYC